MLNVKVIEDIVDVHNIINTLENYEGYENFIFNKHSYNNYDDDNLIFFVNIEREKYSYEYIQISVVSSFVCVSIRFKDEKFIRYLNKKYLSRSTSHDVSSFEIKNVEQFKEFINKDIEELITICINN